MVERQQAQIKIIGETPSKRNYCYVAFDQTVGNYLTELLSLERQLSKVSLNPEQRETAIVSHIRIWNKLPDYYKSELADLTSITA